MKWLDCWWNAPSPTPFPFFQNGKRKTNIEKRERERERERESTFTMKTKPPSRFAGPVKQRKQRFTMYLKRMARMICKFKKRKRDNPFLSPKALLIILFTIISVLSVFEKIYEVKDLRITLWWIRKNILRPLFFFFFWESK